MELHRFFRYAIEKMCKEKKSLNHFIKKRAENREKERIGVPFSVIEQNLFVFLPNKAKKTEYEYYTDSN